MWSPEGACSRMRPNYIHLYSLDGGSIGQNNGHEFNCTGNKQAVVDEFVVFMNNFIHQ
jgi:hypothetical protein